MRNGHKRKTVDAMATDKATDSANTTVSAVVHKRTKTQESPKAKMDENKHKNKNKNTQLSSAEKRELTKRETQRQSERNTVVIVRVVRACFEILAASDLDLAADDLDLPCLPSWILDAPFTPDYVVAVGHLLADIVPLFFSPSPVEAVKQTIQTEMEQSHPHLPGVYRDNVVKHATELVSILRWIRQSQQHPFLEPSAPELHNVSTFLTAVEHCLNRSQIPFHVGSRA